MNSILRVYKLVIAFLIAECSSQTLFPISNGCSQYFDDTTDTNKCTHTVYCKNFVNFRVTRSEECSNLVHNRDNEEYYDPVSVIYETNDQFRYKELPRFTESYCDELTISLDLSVNNYLSVPTLRSMHNLATLKVTKSSLTTAKLSNKYELPALINIDYSYNDITGFEIALDESSYKVLKKLNISHNSLVTIPESTFNAFPSIESLDLSYNYIETLDMEFFDGIKKLLHLNLSNNIITYIDFALSRQKYMVTLDLSHNLVQLLKETDFAKLVNLQEIKVNSNKISSIEKHVFDKMASLTTVNLEDNVLTIIDPDMFTNNTKLANVYLSNNKFKTLPKNMFSGKTIFKFTIEDNQLEGALERGSFEGLAIVTELDLSGQHLSSVENYAFAGIQHLDTLLLNNNNIELLGNYSFKGLQNLNYLDLSYNKIDGLDIVTEDLISLQTLILHHNEITHISSNVFISLGSLKLLDLSHNNISHFGSKHLRSLQSLTDFKISENPLSGTIEENTFDGLSALPILDISGTLINKVNNGSLMGMTILRELNMSHSNIIELQYNALSYVGNIRIIDLSYNQLSVFDVNTTDFSNLESLMLNKNMLQVISPTLFDGLTVSTVVLSHNKIHTFDKYLLTSLKHVRILDLSYNPELEFDLSSVGKAPNLDKLYLSGTKAKGTFDNINEIPLITLEMAYSNIKDVNRLNLHKLPHLQTLLLNDNAVLKLEVGAVSNLTFLRELDMSYNKLYYIQPGTFKDNLLLALLNISHNNLLEISHGIFRGLRNVVTIDLSFNKIKSLHRSRFYDVENLRTLIADYNEIDFISDEDFFGTRLSRLSIGGNPLPCEILHNLKTNNHALAFTAITTDETNYNVEGITCDKDGHLKSKITSATNEHDKLLLDIRNILYNVSKGQFYKEPGKATHSVIEESSILAYISEREQKQNEHNEEIIASIRNLTTISNLTSIVNTNTNLLLEKILKALNTKESVPLPTSKPIVVFKENSTSADLLSYINKIKQDLQDSIAIEKQNFVKLDDKIEKMHSKIEQPKTRATPVHENLHTTNGDRQKSSVFTEVCVGLILVMLIGFVVYKIYKYRLYNYTPRGRSVNSSTRNIAESMESPNL